MSTVLIPIDVQEGFTEPSWGPRSNPEFEARVSEALAGARAARLPVWHVQHLSRQAGSPLRPAQPGVRFSPFAAPLDDEPVYQKHVNSAFIGTTLERDLVERGIRHLVLLGLTADHCVSTTARMAANLGFEVTILHDATAAHDRFDVFRNRVPAELVHQAALASLNGEFARLISTRRFVETITRRPTHAHA